MAEGCVRIHTKTSVMKLALLLTQHLKNDIIRGPTIIATNIQIVHWHVCFLWYSSPSEDFLVSNTMSLYYLLAKLNMVFQVVSVYVWKHSQGFRISFQHITMSEESETFPGLRSFGHYVVP